MKKKQASWVYVKPLPKQGPENKPETIKEVKPTESEAHHG